MPDRYWDCERDYKSLLHTGHAVESAACFSCASSALVERSYYDGIFQKHVFQSLRAWFARWSRRRGIGVEKQICLPVDVEKREEKIGAGNARSPSPLEHAAQDQCHGQ